MGTFCSTRCLYAEKSSTTAYGARIPIPEDRIDLLVAGPSCVDFSALNTKKKGWENEAKGESVETCRAVICFATRSKPSLVVIENVANAPWGKIQSEFENAGYFAQFIKLDTKDFYIPHTRQRGYLICVAKDRLPDGGKSVKTALTSLKAFKRPASAPVEAFLLPEDDPRVHRARKDFIKDENGDGKEATDADWIVCHGRYDHYRHQKQLGNLRPMTYWQPGGTCSVPDYVWKDWARVQGERVLDTIDIAYLRKAVDGIDTQYKT
jgi:site-specific DNA-cytosine methylase